MQPREGHLSEALRIMAYSKHHSNAVMTFDDTPVNWNEADFIQHVWSTFYRGAQEHIC
jgi:hypothetical protein